MKKFTELKIVGKNIIPIKNDLLTKITKNFKTSLAFFSKIFKTMVKRFTSLFNLN